ncbi:MAG: AbrB/MazE/SpoVT family DNA-binding domain-containing protein [Anaerolineae bacterium]|nr:AbrB/MazE/SpoVT family DNA-binding domain-containing protein [Anaerolineae bacterium]
MITTVAEKNQITIPAPLARELNLKPGTRLDWFIDEAGRLVAQPLPRRALLARKAAGMGRPWLPEGVDPIAYLLHERTYSERDEGLT